MTVKKQKDVTFLHSHFFLFSSITFPFLVLIICFKKNVTTFHEKEVRSFGFCWSFLWRGSYCLQCPKLAKKSFNSKTTKFKFPVFKLLNLGYFWGSIPEKIPCLTFWNKNLWSLWSKNAPEHIFCCKNSALRHNIKSNKFRLLLILYRPLPPHPFFT